MARKLKVEILILLFLFPVYNFAQNSELVTDRPDITESAVVVPVGSFQFEIGFDYESTRDYYLANSVDVENITIGSTLFRYGINSLFEFRFGGEYLSSTTSDRRTINAGIQNLFAGTKFQIFRDQDVVTNGAVIVTFGLPYGNEKLRPSRIEPSLNLSFDKDISEKISLGINIGVLNESETNTNIFNFSSALGISITKVVGCFVEYWSLHSKSFITSKNLNAGITYLHRENLQLDLSVSTQTNGEKRINGGIGISFRLPN